MKIATWNVNSLRVRLPHVLAWLAAEKPDVLALQELKLPDEKFPLDEIQQAGYMAVFSGQKTYNGVAILSKTSATDVVTDFPHFIDPQRRILCATINDVRILNIYVPNGESTESEKYLYKLNWLKALHDFLQTEIKHHKKMIILGDFNIAPSDLDVHDPALWEGRVLCSDPERAALQTILQLGFQDVFRALYPSEKSFSWWDYRMNAFKRKMGLRIDLILSTVSMMNRCGGSYIDKAQRALEQPSDHAPVVAEFT